MEKIQFSIAINAPKEKVWHVMLNDTSYRKWTAAFHPGSYYEGNWETGSTMKFIGPNDDGTESGIYSRIKENRPYEFISIEHIGEILNGKESTEKKWENAFENYTFTEKNGVTEVFVETDTVEEYKKMFETMWPNALKILKELAESKVNDTITVETVVKVPIEKAWDVWNTPSHIEKWNSAVDDWESSNAENDLRTGGKFKVHMGAKDKSAGFDFEGTYTEVKPMELIEYDMPGEDKRHVKIEFTKVPEGTRITETFDIEYTNSAVRQRQGWQSIMNNFKKYAESL